MAKKIDYPDTRKASKKKNCQICSRSIWSRGYISHLRMGHYGDIVKYYSYLLSLLENIEGNRFTPSQIEEIKELTSILEQFIENREKITEDAIPVNLTQKMKDFGFNDRALKEQEKMGGEPATKQAHQPQISTSNAAVGKKSSSSKFEGLNIFESRDLLNAYCEQVEEQLQRYRNTPILIKIDLEGILIKRKLGLDVSEDLQRWKYITGLLRRQIESKHTYNNKLSK